MLRGEPRPGAPWPDRSDSSAARRGHRGFHVFRRHHLHFALRLTARAYRALTALVAMAGLVFAVLVLALRFFVLPNIDRWRTDIEVAASAAAGQRITIAAVSGGWSGARPRLRMEGVVVHDAAGRPALELGRAEVTLALRSLMSGKVQLHQLAVDSPELLVRRDAAGNLFVAGFPVSRERGDGRFMEWFMGQSGVEVRNATVTWLDEARGAPPLALTELDVRLEGGLTHTRFGLSVRPPASLGLPLQLRGDLRRPRAGMAQPWRGRLYLRAPYLDIGGVRPWADLPARIDSGAGDVEAWIDIDARGLQQAVADVRLAGLALGLSGELPVLALSALQGRLQWTRREGGGFEAQARRLSVLPPEGGLLREANIVLRRGGAGDPSAATVVEADRLELAVLARLAPALPLPEQVRTLVTALSPAGQVEALSVRVPHQPRPDGPGVEVSGRLLGVSVAASERWPGVSGLSGRLHSDASGGRLELDSAPLALSWPRLFPEPLRFDRVQVAAEWTLRAGTPAVSLSRFVAIGPDFTAVAAGSWQGTNAGPGVLDLSASVPAVAVATLPRYVPLVAGPQTRAWLSGALLAGTARDVRVRIQGDLGRFPFLAPGTGLFEVTTRVEQGRLAFAPGWPPLEDIQGRLAFRGQGLAFEGAARTLGLRIGRASVAVADLAHHDAVLEVKGDAQAPLAEALRYLQASPVGRWTGNVVEGARGGGAGRLSLELSLPLARTSETRVRGTYAMSDASLAGARAIPDMAGVNGALQFTETGVSVTDAAAILHGMPVRFGLTAGPAGVSVTGAGRMRAQALRERFDFPWLRHLEGEAGWRASATVRRGRTEFQIDSDLEGMAVRLPGPLAKPAAARQPLRVQRRVRGGDDLLAISVPGRLEAALLLDGTPPGTAADGSAEVTPITLNLPCWMNSFIVDDTEPSSTLTSPPSTAVSASAWPR